MRGVRQLLGSSEAAILAAVRVVVATFVWSASALGSRIKRSRAPVTVAANQAGTRGAVPSRKPHALSSFGWWFLGVVTGVIITFWGGTWLVEWQAAREQSAILQQLGHIAYVRNGDIWLCRADGSRDWPLVAGAECRGLAWSPDGRQLAFVRSMDTGEESTVALYVADLEAGKLVKCIDDIPGTGTWSEVAWSGYWPDWTTIAFDYEEIHKSPVYAPCLARVPMGEYRGEPVEILPRCYCPWLDATGELYAIKHDPDAGTASIIPAIASTDMEELEEAGYAIRTIALSPRADEVVFSMRWNTGGELWTVEVDLGSAVGAPKKLCDLENIVEIGWHPFGTHLLLRQESHASYHAALPSTEGLLLMERATGVFRQLVSKPRQGYWHFSRQCWSEDGQWLLLTHARYDRTEDEWPIIDPMFLDVQANRRISLSIPLVDDPRLHLQPTGTSIPGKAQWRFDSSGHVLDGKGVSRREELSKGN